MNYQLDWFRDSRELEACRYCGEPADFECDECHSMVCEGHATVRDLHVRCADPDGCAP